MKLDEMNNQINRFTNAIGNRSAKLPVLIGETTSSDCVIAYVQVEKATKYRDNHIRIAENLDSLISELYYYYNISTEDLPKCITPIAGFTTIDLLQKI